MKQISESSFLREHNLKVTPIRKAIFAVLNSSSRPCTVKDIVFAIQKNIKTVDVVTVYRTLHTLEQKNIVQTVNWGGEAVLYELVRGHHHHIVCTRCGDVENVFESKCVKMSLSILKSSKKFSSITKHSFELFGTCRACLKK